MNQSAAMYHTISKAYQTGTASPTEISLKPSPRMPSNFAIRKVTPGSFDASMKSC